MNRRRFIKATSALAGVNAIPFAGTLAALSAQSVFADDLNAQRKPILVAVELSGGNDGLNSVVPYTDDAYYRHRPSIGIKSEALLKLDDAYGLNPGMLGFQRLWQKDQLAIVHGCGYANPSYSHFNSMAYWHTGAPHTGSAFGWMGRVADQLAAQRQDNMLINIAASASLAVKSARHTPVVFDDPERFQRDYWMHDEAHRFPTHQGSTARSSNATRNFLHSVNQSAQASAQRIRRAWRDYATPIDYGIAPMDLPKVAACIDAGLSTQLYHVAFRNNAFDTHVQQPALHQRLLSYACDGIYGFVQDLERLGQADRVVVMVYSEFGRRVPENANLGTDHGSANVMFLAGAPIQGGHYGEPPSLTQLVDGDNLAHTTDFRRVYATVVQDWLGVPATSVLNAHAEPLSILRSA